MAALLSSQDFRSFHPLPPTQRPIHRHPRMVSSRSSSPVCLSRVSSRPSTPVSTTKAKEREQPPEKTETTQQQTEQETIEERSPKSRRMLNFSSEQMSSFREHVEETKKNFVSDTAHLPKSTNMGMSNADAAAALSLNPFNFSNGTVHNWEEDDVDAESTPNRIPKAGASATFNMAIPCLYVSHMANSVNFYQKVLGFSVVGKAATHQAIMRRGPPIKPKVVKGRLVNGVPPASQDVGVRIMLRYRPEEWGELKGDGTGPPQLLIAVSNADDVFKEVSAKEWALRPTGDEYFPEVAFHKARVISKPQNKPWGTREMHMLDPDGNKIVFFHDLAH